MYCAVDWHVVFQCTNYKCKWRGMIVDSENECLCV